jgi:hypothetical protein
MAGMTTDELIKQVLEHGDDGCFLHGECDTYQSAPLLARKLQRALEVLEGIYDGTYDAADTNVFLDEIEAMQ